MVLELLWTGSTGDDLRTYLLEDNCCTPPIRREQNARTTKPHKACTDIQCDLEHNPIDMLQINKHGQALERRNPAERDYEVDHATQMVC